LRKDAEILSSHTYEAKSVVLTLRLYLGGHPGSQALRIPHMRDQKIFSKQTNNSLLYLIIIEGGRGALRAFSEVLSEDPIICGHQWAQGFNTALVFNVIQD